MSELEDDAPNFVALLDHHAQQKPDQLAYTYLIDGEQQQQTLTFAELAKQAKQFAHHLLLNHQPGERALLLFHPGLDYIRALFACFYAGLIAVPAYPPGNKHYRHRLHCIIQDAQPRCVLSTTALINKYENFSHLTLKHAPLNCYAYQPQCLANNPSSPLPAISADTIALLQYTSGSLGEPKGVVVTHHNLLCNQRMIKQAFAHNQDTVFASWLPLFHDMGLIGNTLQPCYLGVHCVFMSPVKFLQSPIRWLNMIARFKATTSGAPNFAYQLCVNKITEQQLQTLDLSHWRLAYCGAEPIRAATVNNFVRKFKTCGFNENAFYPCYGLAEATLFVSGKPAQRKTRILTIDRQQFQQKQITLKDTGNDTLQLVSCGQSWSDEQICIVDPDSHERCADNTVGEIWLSGSHIAQGYWNKLPETLNTFHAYLAKNHSTPFLRTGDLGFLHDKELYITGRLKELLIINGKNHYPQDIELSAYQSHTLLRDDGAAAFAIEEANAESLVVIAETQSRYISQTLYQTLINKIKQTIYTKHNLVLKHVTLIQPGTLPRTSSGKIQRHNCREKYLAQQLSLTKIQCLQSKKPEASISLTE